MKKQILKYKDIFIKKFKIVDIFGLLLILFIISLSYLLLNRKVEYITVKVRLFNYEGAEYRVGGNKPRPWYVEQITPGKKQVGGLGKTLIEITDVYNYVGPTELQDTYVTLKIRATQNRTNKQYIYNGSPLLIHDIKSFKIKDVLVVGEIIEIGSDKTNLQKKKGKFLVSMDLFSQVVGHSIGNVLIDGVENYVVQSLKEGMEINDNHDGTVVEIKKIKKSHGIRSWVGPSGYMQTIDPNFMKVTLQLEIVGEKIGNYYYYRREAPLIINQGLHLIFDNTSVVGIITKVEQISK